MPRTGWLVAMAMCVSVIALTAIFLLHYGGGMIFVTPAMRTCGNGKLG
jgi:hypothetical protein